MKIPFSWFPGSWGLKGKSREIAQAEYELKGEELDLKLLDLKYDDHECVEYKRNLLELKLKYKHIDENTYNKEIATLNEEPYFAIIASEYVQLPNGLGRFIHEFDWNDFHIDELIRLGYQGYSDEDIIEQWLIDYYRQQIPDAEAMTSDTNYEKPQRTRKRKRGDDHMEFS